MKSGELDGWPMDVYPSLTYRDVPAACAWLRNAFGLRFEEFGDGSGGAAIIHGDGVILLQPDRPEHLHGSHTGTAWVYLVVDDVDAHYEHTKQAGIEVLNEPHDAFDGAQRGYSARDLEGNLWTFGIARFSPAKAEADSPGHPKRTSKIASENRP